MRAIVPPFFIFKWYPTPASSRSVQFKGLAAPGFSGLPATADLVAVWKTTKGQLFQNYRAIFTVLDVPVVPRGWLAKAILTSACDAPPLYKACMMSRQSG
ncbi:hypothetical protein [Bradyrhizobium sp. USDA 3311]